MKDPGFVADSKKQTIGVGPTKGIEMEIVIKQLYATPPDVIVAAKASIAD